MDNRKVDVVSEGPFALERAIALAWQGHGDATKATHFKIAGVKWAHKHYVRALPEGEHEIGGVKCTAWCHHERVIATDGAPTMILLWKEENGAIALPFPITQAQAVTFVAHWLGQVPYGGEPDHDGSNGKGFRVFTDDWGHVVGHHYAIVGVMPAWAMYGK